MCTASHTLSMLTRVQCTVCGSIIHTTIQFHNKSQTVEASKRRVDVWTLHSSTSAVHRTSTVLE